MHVNFTPHFRADVEKGEVQKLGGLHVVGTERHESRRIDNQLRGRSGRQGDPGSTRYFLSLEVCYLPCAQILFCGVGRSLATSCLWRWAPWLGLLGLGLLAVGSLPCVANYSRVCCVCVVWREVG